MCIATTNENQHNPFFYFIAITKMEYKTPQTKHISTKNTNLRWIIYSQEMLNPIFYKIYINYETLIFNLADNSNKMS